MKYHIEIKFGGAKHIKWNLTKHDVIDKFVLPFINGHVVLVKRASGKKLLNMKSVNSLIIYKTPGNLRGGPHQSIHPPEFDDGSLLECECTEDLLNEVKVFRSNKSATSLLQKSFIKPERKVFVIMKYNEPTLDLAYIKSIMPVVNEFELECVRIDELENSGKISDQILEEIATSMFVIADLTGGRPNCYYETGFAHALGKELILTVHSEEAVAFNLSGYRFIEWDSNNDLEVKLRSRISDLFKNRLSSF